MLHLLHPLITDLQVVKVNIMNEGLLLLLLHRRLAIRHTNVTLPILVAARVRIVDNRHLFHR